MSRKFLQLDFIEPYSLTSSPIYWCPLLVACLIMNQYPMNTISVLIKMVTLRRLVLLAPATVQWKTPGPLTLKEKPTKPIQVLLWPQTLSLTVKRSISSLAWMFINCNQFTVCLGACSSDLRVCF